MTAERVILPATASVKSALNNGRAPICWQVLPEQVSEQSQPQAREEDLHTLLDNSVRASARVPAAAFTYFAGK